MVRLREALDGGLRRLGVLRRARRARAVDLWAEVVGPTAARASRATRCRDGVLFVVVESSVWANELSLLKADIVKKLNKLLGKGTIVDVRFHTRGSINAGNRDSRAGEHPGRKGGETTVGQTASRARRGLSRSEMEEISVLSATIADPEVRAAFARAALAARLTDGARCGGTDSAWTERTSTEERTRS
ncbi:MAG: DUF721 domain-containing protein [Firmicutes bacterium]|nr:DUF721 domain-containing protein [Bacillota bacterium]MDH7495869.1 DUF721 domain-containing protein [Bacillota bacterium]